MRSPRFWSRIRRICVALFACTLFSTLWLGHGLGRSQPTVRATDAQELVQIGVDYYHGGNFPAAIEQWQLAYEVYKAAQDLPALAIVSENLARASEQTGQTTQEIDYWEVAIATTRTLGNQPQKLGHLITLQAQAYSRLGQHRRAIALLCGNDKQPCLEGSALQISQQVSDQMGEVAALGSLGEAYRMSGDYPQATLYLKQGLDLSNDLDAPEIKTALLNSLGNTTAAGAQILYRRADESNLIGNEDQASRFLTDATKINKEAIDYIQQSYEIAQSQADLPNQVRSLLSLIAAYERADNQPETQRHWQTASRALSQLPESKFKAFTAIKLADFLDPLAVRQSQATLNATIPSEPTKTQATALLKQALEIGERLNNPRVISFAWGKLGNLDERTGQLPEALEKTQKARHAADQDLAARDSLYLWAWQMGRILNKQEKPLEAAQAYNKAIEVLEDIRSNILNANRDLQFDFRDKVEPIYRQYVELNLEAVPIAAALNENNQGFEALDKALLTLDSLKVAELQNYFANDCVIIPTATRVDNVGDSVATAVLSTAILNNELAVILSLPDGSKKVSQQAIDKETFIRQVNEFRVSLEAGVQDYAFDDLPAQQLYKSLIKPFKEDLKAADVKTLVFVNDGLLRSVPMAALYDGQQFLIENFSVATTPSLTLTNPQRLKRPSLNALLLGLSQPSITPERSFDPLLTVDDELNTVSQKLPNSKILLNEAFSVEALRQSLKQQDYRILHIATHGTFGFEPEDNFVITGAKETTDEGEFNEKLTISDLDEIIREIDDPNREPIELLTLTACETAIGDSRSTLGLAGVAIRAGVRSAVATLWAVNADSPTELISQFYENLKDPELTKAEALRKAQVSMLQSDDFILKHPYHWSPFVLIGNWL